MIYIVQNKSDLDMKIEEAGEKLVVIDFFANWCGPCKIISPKLEELSEQYSDKALVLKVNVDDCEEVALEYNVTSMPTFVFIKNKQIVEVFIGGNSEKLSKNMEKFILHGVEPIAMAAPAAVEEIAAVDTTPVETENQPPMLE